MKYLGYSWTVLTNLFVLIIAFSIFNTADTKFERMVLSLLVLVYIQITSFYTLYARSTVSTALANYNQFKELKHQLKLETNEYDEEEVNGIKQKLEESNVKFYINSAFTFILYLVAVFNILTNL